MKKGIAAKLHLIIFLLAGVMAVSAVAWMSLCFQLDDTKLRLVDAEKFNGGWSLVEGEGDVLMDAIPRSLTVERGSIRIRNTLPEISCEDHALCFRTNSEQIRVFVDSREVYNYGQNNKTAFGKYFGTVYSLVPLNTDMSGRQIEIELTALSDEKHDDNYSFYLDNRTAIISTLLLNNMLLFCNCVIGFGFFLLLTIFGLLNLRCDYKMSMGRVYLGLFVLLAQMWAFADAGFMQFFISNKAVSHFMVHASLMLMPVPFALYLSLMFPRWEREYRNIANLYCGYFLLRLVLYVTGLVEINYSITTTHMVIVLGLSYATILCATEAKTPVNKITMAGIFTFFAFVFFTILFFYLFPHLESEVPYYTITLSLGVDILIFFCYMALLKTNLNLATDALVLEHQAYTDAMTQVNNRAAFNLEMHRLDPENYPHLSLFMIDLNNLKQVNDTFGHPAGDRLICTLVQCLEASFKHLGRIYRYGGDEFIVLIEDARFDQLLAAHRNFDKQLESYSERGSHELSVAVGMATRLEPLNAALPVSELLHQADIAMYQSKAKQKLNPTPMQLPHRHAEQIDTVTGILTFASFKIRIYDYLATEEAVFPCIVNFDLNFFDGYNNLFGWDAGNQLLQKLTQMALSLCGSKGFCAHGEADSFWVFTDTPGLDTLLMRIQEETRCFQAQLGDCLLFPSFGLYPVKERSLTVSDMCSRAASAKRDIKGHLDTLYAVYDTEEHRRRIDKMRMISYMQKGLDSHEFHAHFQPKYSCADGRLVGGEALARWVTEPGMDASAGEFTSLFEKSGLILSLDWYILEKTCAFLQRCAKSGRECVPISTNFSRLHVYEEDCVAHVCRIVDHYRLPRRLIEIELTETALVKDTGRVLRLIADLRAQGFTVALDDFGSGLSSLGSLKNLEVDQIKIDRSLISEATGDENGSRIFETVVSLCRQLKIKTVAEGVETQAQYVLMQRCGCDMVQGNYLSEPLDEESFRKLMNRHQLPLGRDRG